MRPPTASAAAPVQTLPQPVADPSTVAADAAAAPPSPQRLLALLQALGEGLLERETAVRLSLLAALAGEHVLLTGPPGTAKSALARRLHRAFEGAPYFERLLTRFSTPEELFGPLSLKALEHDRYERLTAGFLPSAGIAFLDEVFKANSAILNALLTLLNERLFDNGSARVPVPLLAVVGASNEGPEEEALAAFHDRFLVRVPVAPVGDDAFAALLSLPAGEPPPPPRPVTAAERAALAAAAARVRLGEDFTAGCAALRGWLGERRQPMSDRRWRQFAALVRTAAAAEGRSVADRLDLWPVPFVAAATPADVPALQAWFLDHGAAAPVPRAPWLARAVEAFERQLGIEQNLPAVGGDGGAAEGAGKMALARAMAGSRAFDGDDRFDPSAAAAAGTAAGEALGAAAAGPQRLLSERVAERQRHRFGALHVRARVAQVGELSREVDTARARARSVRARLAEALALRLWWPPALRAQLLARHDDTLAMLDGFAQRLSVAQFGFSRLPVDDGDPGIEPVPVALDAAPAGA